MTFATEIKNFPEKLISNSVVKKGCLLCLSDGADEAATHGMNKCTIYKNPTAKIAKLKQFGGCAKCGYTNHNAKSCRFRFRHACSICNKPHLTYLCMYVERETAKTTSEDCKAFKPNRKSTEQSTLNQLVQFAVQNEKFENVILPTFTVDISPNTSKRRKIRGLWDSASQSSFILKSLPKQLKLKVIQSDMIVTLSGFNEEGKLNLLIDNQNRTIHAISISNIRTNIRILELKDVVRGCQRKGYTMADERLLDGNCNNVDILIGMDNG